MSNFVEEKFSGKAPILIKKIKAVIKSGVSASFPEVQDTENLINIEHPSNKNYGDYSTNIALILAGKLKMSPIDVAKKISRKIGEYIISGQTISFLSDSNSKDKVMFKADDILENVKSELPGFVNMYLSNKCLISQMTRLLKMDLSLIPAKSEKNKLNTLLQGSKIMTEFTDPNPFKDFHIGHLYSNSVGESICRLLEEFGAVVKRANYFGDVGMHVAKSVWGMRKKIENQKSIIENLEKSPLKKRVEFLQDSYATGAKSYEKDEKAKEEITRINYLIYMSAQELMKKKHNLTPEVDYGKYIDAQKEEINEISRLFIYGREWSLSYFETIYGRLGTKFDYYYPESEVGEKGVKIVRDNLGKGVFEESEGAIVFRGDKFGLHTRVFINKLGLPTYEAKELGLAPAKFKQFHYDFSLIITGKEIDEYFRVLLAALKQIHPELAEKTLHLGHGMVRLPEGKMSSRTGEIVSGIELIETVKKKIRDKIEKSPSDYSKSEYENVMEKAAIAAIKYSFLKVGLPGDIVFDPDKSVSFEGDSGPYLLYTYARCRSVMKKSNLQKQSKSLRDLLTALGVTLNNEERELLRTIYLFDEALYEGTRNFAPSIICSFLFETAKNFNLFYQKHSILKPAGQDSIRQKETILFRLALTETVGAVLKKGLYLLGIETTERM